VTYRGVDDYNGRALIQTEISDTETGTCMVLKYISLADRKVPYVIIQLSTHVVASVFHGGGHFVRIIAKKKLTICWSGGTEKCGNM
jgi:hypothetical protein